MERKRIYIQAAEQISIQQPLSEEWMTTPLLCDESLTPTNNPTFREYISPVVVRRMCGIMKRALTTMIKVIRDTGVECPDAIITGTSFGSLEYTERFLNDMIDNGEQTLSPTYFMQSTHNTVSSTLSIHIKDHGYNSTYSHGRTSFELAVLDAWMQMQLGKIGNALVGAHDEMTETHFTNFRKVGYLGQKGMCPSGEVAMSMLLRAEGQNECDLCEIAGVKVCRYVSTDDFRQQVDKFLTGAGITMAEVSAVMTGVNGNPSNDCHYDVVAEVFGDVPQLQYKNIFGENHTVPALGLYASAHCLKKQMLPEYMYRNTAKCDSLNNILFINIVEGKDCSLILLKKI